MFGTVGKPAWSMRLLAFAFLLFTAVTIRSEIRGGLEARKQADLEALDMSISPVRYLHLDERECRDGFFIIAGVLNKTRYPDHPLAAQPEKLEATLTAMLVYNVEDPPDLLAWRQTSPGDQSGISRKYGEQSVDFVIEADCDVEFTLETTHISPLTGRVVRTSFGPFYP